MLSSWDRLLMVLGSGGCSLPVKWRRGSELYCSLFIITRERIHQCRGEQMSDEQHFKVVDRRPFNPDGTPREVPPEEHRAAEAPSSEPLQDTTQGPERPGAPSV